MKQQVLSFLIIASLFCSCSKKIDQPIVTEKQKEIKLLRYGSENGGFYEYTYSGKQITKEKYTGNSSNLPRILTFSYHSSGKLKEMHMDYLGKSINTRSEYIFDNDKVVRISTYNDVTNELLNYTLREYPAGKLINKYFSKQDVLIQKNEYLLSADGKNYTSMKTFAGETLSYTTNILKIDNKQNPFKLFPLGYTAFTNLNNAIDVDLIFAVPSSNQSSRLTLEYNEFGYPTKETNQNGVVVRIFEYIIE
ncbi:MAG: hypothetical protein EOP00_14675 [Pedobacter sp.]|nr:MAG: hypothetical protein EOP00_14675 [Pedobacter sp.]